MNFAKQGWSYILQIKDKEAMRNTPRYCHTNIHNHNLTTQVSNSSRYYTTDSEIKYVNKTTNLLIAFLKNL